MANDVFTVKLINQETLEERELYVIPSSIDENNLKIAVKYPGSVSGKYDLEVYSARNGFLDTEDVEFEAII
jgi:hypothetical protein